MLFNSPEFLFVFFPLTLALYFWVGRVHVRAAAGFLGLASLVFYAWWSVAALPLLLGSIVFNYLAGRALSRRVVHVAAPRSRVGIAWAVGTNLAVLALFKYADFFVANVNLGLTASGMAPWPMLHWVLPIGISFYTFTQIAFLVDCWRGKVREHSVVNYLLFVTYFPHLIAGPVLHHAQMMPQFARPSTYRPEASKLALGLSIFTLGLAKKMLIADPLGQYADMLFGAASSTTLNTLAAWLGVLAYTFQLYFDFSGYSDMAVGLSLCLGIDLPINFWSPYKSRSIIDFWRRWHISLSSFLRDYLYVPLGGSRRGEWRRHVNLLVTMLLGGLWHGASWTFVLWGAVHGVALVINHLWRKTRLAQAWGGRAAWGWVAWVLTFFVVCMAWVLFRADSLSSAMAMYRALFGAHGHDKPFAGFELPYAQAEFYRTLLAALVISLAAPTAPEFARRVMTACANARLPVVCSAVSALCFAALLAWCVHRFGQHSPFLYFQF